VWLPTTLISWILAALPSWISMSIDAVAVEVGDVWLDLDVVFAAVVVLGDQLLLHLVEGEAVERLTFGQAGRLQAFQELIGLDVLVAVHGEAGDGGALLHLHDQDRALLFQFHVVEEAGLEQRLDGLLRGGIGHRLAGFDRQVAQHGAGGNALQALDADVADGERLKGVRRHRDGQGGEQDQCGDSFHRRFRNSGGCSANRASYRRSRARESEAVKRCPARARGL